MFNETEHHKEQLQSGQKRLRIGSSIPANAVSLAYIHSEELRASENVLITDIARTIPENTKGNKEGVIELWPNDQGLLRTWEGEESIGARSLLLTDKFMDDIPLYYNHVSTFPIYKSANVSLEELESNVILVDAYGKKLDDSKVYRIYFSSTKEGIHHIHLFTNFRAQPIENIKMFYTAWKDGKSVVGHSETVRPQEAFKRTDSLHNVSLGLSDYGYFRSDSERIGESKLFVEGVPLKDIDYRQPISFRYKLKGAATSSEGETTEIHTPWIYDSVFGEGQLSAVDTYYRDGWKDLDSAKTAREILAKFGDMTLFEEHGSHVVITAESSKEEVDIYLQQEGHTPVRARTKALTGVLPEPDSYKTEFRAKRYTVDIWMQVDDGPPEIIRKEISVLDGHRKIAGPFKGKSISVMAARNEDPVTVYVADDSVYIYTEAVDTYHVPKYAAYIQNNNQLQVLSPTSIDEKDNWYVRLKNGQFRRMSLMESEESVDRFYSLPEYYSQSFDSEYGMPHKRVLGETPELIADSRIRVLHTPLKVYEENGQRNLEVYVNGVPVEVIGWDEVGGMIDLDVQLKEVDRIEVSYIYEETSFTYKGYLDERTGRYWHLDVNPGPGHMYTDKNPDTGEIVEEPSFKLINKTVYIYMRPSAEFGLDKRMIEGSYKSKTVYHSFEVQSTSDDILLARINVRPNSSKEDMKIIDTRTRGGGVKESIAEELMKRIEKESGSYWDVGNWDGEPISLNGISVIRLSRRILKQHGGHLSERQVEESVKRHMAYGSLPIIEYIDDTSRLIERPRRLRGTTEEDVE